MGRIVALSGSLRRASFNTGLLKAAESLFPETVEVHTIADIPLYDADLEAEHGVPDAVARLKDRVAGADGLLLASPEYNNSVPGAFKNAVDWMSRPPDDIPRVFHDRPVALIGATPGGFGTAMAQSAWLPVLRTLRMRPYFQGRLMVSRATELFDKQGRLTDDKTRASLETFLEGFFEFTGLG